MDIRTLQYFLAVAREESISGAAEFLHMTQPPLSRQLKELEAELGKQLFIRGNRKITLTEDGMILRKRAEEIVALMEKTKAEINASAENITGDIYIGCAETEGMRMLAKIISKIRQEYDHIHFHIFSGQAEDVSERLDSGLLDFGLFIEPADLKKYDFIKLPITDIWGLWMTKASPLAENKTIKPHDLLGLPLIISNQAMVKNEIAGWMGGNYDNLNIVATYNLLYNASLMVEEGVGYALSIDRIIKSYDDSPLCFRPLEPTLEVGLDIVWKKYQTFSKASEKFLEYLKKEYDRQQKLVSGESASLKRMQQSKADYLSMKSRMEAAAAQLALLGTDTATLNREGIRTYLDIRAPRNGYVTNMDINAGKYFAAGDPVCDVIDKSKPMLQLTAYEKDLDKLQPNTHFTFKVNGMPDTTFTAELVSVDQMVDNVNRSIKVYARILEAYSNFRPGMYVAAKITDKKH